MYEAALELYADMLPVVRQHLASSPTAKVCLTGHSLGGALASLLMLMMVWRGDVPPGRLSPCFTFGAPAAFCDKEEGGSGVGVLERLGLSGSSLVNVVMHLDVVPRIFVCDYTATVSHALMGPWGGDSRLQGRSVGRRKECGLQGEGIILHLYYC